MEVEAIDEGLLAKIIHNDGAENIPVNSLIGVISTDGETTQDIEAFLKKAIIKLKNKNDDANETENPKAINNNMKLMKVKIQI